jgi:hypothetical protein
MKIHPIILNAHEVQATIAGRKVRHSVPLKGIALKWLTKYWFTAEFVVDRGNKLSPFGYPGDQEWQTGVPPKDGLYWVEGLNDPLFLSKNGGATAPGIRWKRMGTVLAVKEQLYQEGELGVIYTADDDYVEESLMQEDKWPYGGKYNFRKISAQHMPIEVARIWMEVTNVTCKRVQEITEEEAKAEGVFMQSGDDPIYPPDFKYCPDCGGQFVHGAFGANLGYTEVDCYNCDTHIKRFKINWQSKHGPDSWNNNEPVFSVEYRVLSTVGRPGWL